MIVDSWQRDRSGERVVIERHGYFVSIKAGRQEVVTLHAVHLQRLIHSLNLALQDAFRECQESADGQR